MAHHNPSEPGPPPSADEGVVLYEKRDRIAYLTINRPEARNAVSPEVLNWETTGLQHSYWNLVGRPDRFGPHDLLRGQVSFSEDLEGIASFSKSVESTAYQQLPPDLPDPESVPTFAEQHSEHADELGGWWVREQPIEMVFIRAPILESIGAEVEVLAEFEGHPILVREKNILASTFHPELTNDTTIHEYFVKMAANGKP